MQELKSIAYIYNTDDVIMKKGLVLRSVLSDDSVRWTSITGNQLGDYVSELLEKRYNTIKNVG